MRRPRPRPDAAWVLDPVPVACQLRRRLVHWWTSRARLLPDGLAGRDGEGRRPRRMGKGVAAVLLPMCRPPIALFAACSASPAPSRGPGWRGWLRRRWRRPRWWRCSAPPRSGARRRPGGSGPAGSPSRRRLRLRRRGRGGGSNAKEGGGVGGGGGGGGDEVDCDLFDGEWVRARGGGYPLYDSRDCPFLDVGFRCSENGRPDASYTKWRWQPTRCDLPRFDAKSMLEKLRNRRVVFVGDSIGRNQWESLLCMLSTAVHNKSSIYEVNGSPITKHMGFLIFNFRDYNCTVEYYRSPFIVLQGRAPAGAPEIVKYTIRVDAMDWMSDRGKWKDADVLIFNTGHWWNNEKTVRGGAYFQEGDEVKMDMTVTDAYRRSIHTLSDWLHREVNTSKTHVIYRTYAPVHFRGGDWKTGGSCHLETLPDLTPPESLEEWNDLLKPVNDVLGNNLRPTLSGLDMLNVTQMTAQRKDGHLSVYLSPSGPVPRYKQDCSHWCLPGVPDTWNELLYALVMKRHTRTDQNLSLSGTITRNTG